MESIRPEAAHGPDQTYPQGVASVSGRPKRVVGDFQEIAVGIVEVE